MISDGDCQKGILCTAWWGAHCRVQPSSASGTQSLEACHLRGFGMEQASNCVISRRPIFCPRGRSPHGPGRTTAQQKNVAFPDYPASRDPASASCDRMQNVSRRNAVQLLASRAYSRRVPLPELPSEAFIMPRTVLQWKW